MLQLRTMRRSQLMFNLRVYDVETNKLVAYVCDISSRGVGFVSDYPLFESRRARQFRIELPCKLNGMRSLRVKARLCWRRQNRRRSLFYNGGYEFVEIDQALEETIVKLIETYHI